MTNMPRRRAGLLAGCLLLALLASTEAETDSAITSRLQQIESRLGGRLGVSAWQEGSSPRIDYRSEERFPMASTFKLLLAAAILHRVEKGEERIDRVVPISEADLLDYAPVVKENLSKGSMTVEALSAAIMEYSDNSAANLLLATMGGPDGYTAYARSIGDKATRLDRLEEELNTGIPGDPRDTTTPGAMVTSMRAVLFGDALNPESRRKLSEWMMRNTTGAAMIRAGVPKDWRVGDKTGRGGNGSTNDIAIIYPPNARPILLCVYSTEGKIPAEERESAIAEVAGIVLQTLKVN